MDKATEEMIGKVCTQANDAAKDFKERFYFSEEGTISRFDDNGGMYCIREIDSHYQRFVPAELVRSETLSLIAQIQKLGIDHGRRIGRAEAQQEMRDALGMRQWEAPKHD